MLLKDSIGSALEVKVLYFLLWFPVNRNAFDLIAHIPELISVLGLESLLNYFTFDVLLWLVWHFSGFFYLRQPDHRISCTVNGSFNFTVAEVV
jgi:hypothetical protein